MSNEKDNAIFPEILPDEKGKLLGHNWLKVPKKKRIGDESLATPNSTKTAGYDRFIFEEYIDKDGLVKEGLTFPSSPGKFLQSARTGLSRIGDILPYPNLYRMLHSFYRMMHNRGGIRGNRQYSDREMERSRSAPEEMEEDQPQQVQQQEVSLSQGQPQAGPMPQAQPPQQPQGQVSGIQQPQETAPEGQGAQGGIDSSNEVVQKILASLENVINTPDSTPKGQRALSGIDVSNEVVQRFLPVLENMINTLGSTPKGQRALGGIDLSNVDVQALSSFIRNVINTPDSTPKGQRALGGIDLSNVDVQRILPALENVINTLRSTPKGQGAQGGIDLSNVDVRELSSFIRNVINTPGSTSGEFLRSDTPASMITYNDLLRKPRVNISQIPDIPLLDQFIREPIAASRTQQVFKRVYSTLGYTPPVLADTLKRMYDLYEAGDNVATPYQAGRLRGQITRLQTIMESDRKLYEDAMDLLDNHPEVLGGVAVNAMRDAADNTDRQIALAAGIAAVRFLRTRRNFEVNKMPFNEEKQKSTLREAVRNAFYGYVGGSDSSLIAKVEELARRLIQAETNPRTQQQTQQIGNKQQPQQAQQPTPG